MLCKLLFAAALLVAVCACHPTRSATDAAPAANSAAGALSDEDTGQVADRAAAGFRLAEARCAGCHAVTPGEVSSHSDAPPFASIARRPGLTEATASTWLGTSHNFPDEMNFALEPGQAQDLAAYLLTLRQTNSD